MNYAADHNIYALPPPFTFEQIDTIMISYQTSFDQIAENLPISLDCLRFLNPQYKLGIIPETGSKQPLILPYSLISKYLTFENNILTTQNPNSNLTKRTNKIVYTVCKGDFLHKIAMKNNCSLEDIRLWNKLKSDSISPGQKLILYVAK